MEEGVQLSLQGELKVTRPIGRIDPNPGVPLESTTEIALHRGKSLTLVLVGVVLDLPGRPLRTKTASAEVVAIAPSIGKSPSQFHLTETERRNESSNFSSRSPTFPLINHYLINEIVLFSGFEFCWQHSYDRSTLNLCWCCILHLPAQLPPSRPSPPWPGSPPTRTLPRSCRSGQGDEWWQVHQGGSSQCSGQD